MHRSRPEHAARFRYASIVRRPLRETITMDLALVARPRLDPAARAMLLKSMRSLRAPMQPR